MRSLGALAALFVLATLNAQAAANKPTQGSPLLPGGNSKEPISIEADKLVYFDKEQKAIYSGNVVAIQGDTRLTCSIMTVHMTKTAAAGAPAAGAAAVGAPAVKVADSGPAPSVEFEQRKPPGLCRSRHCPVEDPDRDGRQRRLRQAPEQDLDTRPRHAERQGQRHQGRQADLRFDLGSGDGRYRRDQRPRQGPVSAGLLG